MYPCMYRHYPIGSSQLGLGLGLEEGPINKVGPMSQPRGDTIDTTSRTLERTEHICAFQANFTLGS